MKAVLIKFQIQENVQILLDFTPKRFYTIICLGSHQRFVVAANEQEIIIFGKGML